MRKQAKVNFINQLLYWEGRINASHLQEHFNISRQAASKIVNDYKATHPNNLIYNASAKAYLLTPNFSCAGNVSNFFDYLATVGKNTIVTNWSREHNVYSYVYEIAPPLRNIQAEQVRSILRAIRDQLKVDIGYISLTSPDYLDRIIEPHALIFDGLRWHVRAYCNKNQEFRDFTLSRFSGEAVIEGKADHSNEQDIKWNTTIDVTFEPDPRLTDKQKRVIANDYQMENGRKSITTRVAMLSYLLKRLHLESYQSSPEAQQIVLSNHCQKEIKPYLFT